ncbi:MAG: NADH:flavin oxidoreductase/NADH oxidase [Sulfobacillus sp.]
MSQRRSPAPDPQHGGHLFAPLQLRSLTLRNRIVVSPMCMYSCPDQDGMANDWHLVHLGSRAVGGAALVFTEATAVGAAGRISPFDLGIWTDAQAQALAPITAFIQSQEALAGIQLAHAGRKASTQVPWSDTRGQVPIGHGGWQPLAPSALAFAPGDRTPKELSIAEIEGIVAEFGAATARALRAGFQVVEVHGAHGYLIHEFLSPLSNNREDQYGGSLANRFRFLAQVVMAVREEWPDDLPLWVRLSATDWAEAGGWDIDQTVEVSRWLKDLGVDVIDCSSGGTLRSAQIPEGPGYQVGFAERVRKEAALTSAAVGLITAPEQASRIIESGQADLVLLARAMLRNPYWPMTAAQELGAEVRWPNQYLRARPKVPVARNTASVVGPQ